MRRGWIVGLVAAALVGVPLGCGSPTDTTDERLASLQDGSAEVVLRYGEEVRVDGSVFSVAFGQVLSDSRCPTDVTCVWAGNAEVEVGIRAGMGPTLPLHLNTTLDPRSADGLGFRITLLELKPSPRAGKKIKAEDYSVRLKVEALD